MAAAAKPMGRRELQEKIVALAWKDEDFRKKFLADPKKQFEERLGTKLPAGLKMTAVAEDENHLHFVIPAKPAKMDALSDADLEKVAGGIDAITTLVTAYTALGTAAILGSIVGSAMEGKKQGW